MGKPKRLLVPGLLICLLERDTDTLLESPSDTESLLELLELLESSREEISSGTSTKGNLTSVCYTFFTPWSYCNGDVISPSGVYTESRFDID